MPNVLIRCYVNDEYSDFSTPCVCLDLDPETVKLWLDRIITVGKLKANNDSLYSMDFWEHNGDFFDVYDLEKGAPEIEGLQAAIESIENGEMVILAPNSPLDKFVAKRLEGLKYEDEDGVRVRTEVDQLEVTDNAVVRCSCVKHTSVRIETVQITVDDLGKLSGGLKVTLE